MAHNITISIELIKVHSFNNQTYCYPVNSIDKLQYTDNISKVARDYGNYLQKENLDAGRYISLLNEHTKVPYEAHSTNVSFKVKERDGELDIDFVFFLKEHGQSQLGYVPALDIKFIVNEGEDAYESAKKAIEVDFKINDRFSFMQSLVEVLWDKGYEIEMQDVKLSIQTLAEREEKKIEKKYSILEQVATLNPIINQVLCGYDHYLEKIDNSLKNNFSKSTLVVGYRGVGKTAIINQYINNNRATKKPLNIWKTTPSILMKELTHGTGWQDSILNVIEALVMSGDILYISRLRELFEVGKYEGNEVSIADFLRSYISRGEITVLTECTIDEFEQIEVLSPSYTSLFDIVVISEPKEEEELHEIVSEAANEHAKLSKIAIEKEAINEVIALHKRFMPYAGFPGKPIRFIENALLSYLENKQKKLTHQGIVEAFSLESGMPVFMIDPTISMNVEAIKDNFNKKVFGQAVAVEELVESLATVKTALARENKPIASLMFIGPTGVGKTELSKVLAKFMFGDENRLVRFDMSEYSSAFDIFNLIGGNGTSGLLTSAIRQEPFSVILFDEIEKADPYFLDLLLQILSEGRLTDGRGNTVNFCSTIIIMTSNIGAEKLQKRRVSINSKLDVVDVKEHFKKAIEDKIKPELFNRIDKIVPFLPLSKDIMSFILERELNLLLERRGIKRRNLNFKIAPEVKVFLAEEGYDKKYGARYLQRTLRRKFISPLSKVLNNLSLESVDVVEVGLQKDEITFNFIEDPNSFTILLEELQKDNLANMASDERRAFDNFKNSFAYNRLSNNVKDYVYTMEVEYKTKPLKNIAKEVLVLEQYKKLESKILDLEEEIFEVNFGVVSYKTNFEDRLQEWSNSLFENHLNLVHVLYPKYNKCKMTLYGKSENVIKTYNEYLSIWQLLGFTITNPKAIYHQTSGDFKYLDYKEGNSNKFENLYGIEFIVKGSLALPVCKDEEGLQLRLAQNREEKLMVSVMEVTNKDENEDKKLETPGKINRKEFYEGKPRRTITSEKVTDTKLAIEVSNKNYKQKMVEYYSVMKGDILREILRD